MFPNDRRWTSTPKHLDLGHRNVPCDCMTGSSPSTPSEIDRTDTIVFLLDSDVETHDYRENILELIGWHREALASNELTFTLAHSSAAALSHFIDPALGDRRDRADPMYTRL